MTKQRSSSKVTTPTNQFRGAIGAKSSKPLASALGEIKGRERLEDFDKFYSLAKHAKTIGEIILPSQKVTDPRKLGATRVLKNASFAREIYWASVICYYASPIINCYLPLR